MVVNGKSAAAFGIVSGLVCVLVVAGEAGCAGASSSLRKDGAPMRPQHVSFSKLQTVKVKRPIAPSRSRLPNRALTVSSSRQLIAALGDGRPEAIVLAPGSY